MQCKNVERKIGSLPYYHNTNVDRTEEMKIFHVIYSCQLIKSFYSMTISNNVSKHNVWKASILLINFEMIDYDDYDRELFSQFSYIHSNHTTIQKTNSKL